MQQLLCYNSLKYNYCSKSIKINKYHQKPQLINKIFRLMLTFFNISDIKLEQTNRHII